MTTSKVITGLIVLGVIAIVLFVIFYKSLSQAFVGIVYDLLIKPPERTFCLDTEYEYRCVTDRALQEKDPSLCYFLDMGSSDLCISEIIASSNDSSICQKIKQKSYRTDCFEHFKN